jgi:hypothetical protein
MRVTLEKLRALLQVEEQSMNKLAQNYKDQNPVTMFFYASNKPPNST